MKRMGDLTKSTSGKQSLLYAQRHSHYVIEGNNVPTTTAGGHGLLLSTGCMSAMQYDVK